MIPAACPGRAAMRSIAAQSRDPESHGVRRCLGPGSAAHHFVLRCVRDTRAVFPRTTASPTRPLRLPRNDVFYIIVYVSDIIYKFW